jgi:hypothetical protein
MRESSVRGPAVDLSEFERRIRGGESQPAPKVDRLSELARLSQGERQADPYSRILPDPRAPRQAPPPLPPAAQWEPDLRGSYDPAPPVAPEPRYDARDHHDAQGHYAPHQTQTYDEHGYHGEAYAEPDHAQAQHGAHQQSYGQAYHGGAEGEWADESQYLDYGDEPEDESGTGVAAKLRRHFKPWHAAAAIGVIAVGSIAWGFLHRSGAGGSKEIAIINAPEGPVKVRPAAQTDEDAPSKDGAAVLDRKDPTPVKQIVTHQEQAIDPTVAPKVVTLGDDPVDAPHTPALGAQPRKVKTVTVRPDGSRVEDGAGLPPAAVEAPVEPQAVDPASKGATPRPQTKPATTAQAAKPRPAPKAAAVEPPAEADADAPAAPAASASGAYAVQFSAANSEAEARTLLKAVSSKYGVKATFKPASVDGKMVYRVRAANLSKYSANAVCNKVKAAGGSCFVTGN